MKSFIVKLVINDNKIWRAITRKSYYYLENFQFYNLIPIRELMLRNILIDQDAKKEDIKKNKYKWIMILKPKLTKKDNYKLFFD